MVTSSFAEIRNVDSASIRLLLVSTFEQQEYFEALTKDNHPSMASKQFQNRADFLWESAIMILQDYCLQPVAPDGAGVRRAGM